MWCYSIACKTVTGFLGVSGWVNIPNVFPPEAWWLFLSGIFSSTRWIWSIAPWRPQRWGSPWWWATSRWIPSPATLRKWDLWWRHGLVGSDGWFGGDLGLNSMISQVFDNDFKWSTVLLRKESLRLASEAPQGSGCCVFADLQNHVASVKFDWSQKTDYSIFKATGPQGESAQDSIYQKLNLQPGHMLLGMDPWTFESWLVSLVISGARIWLIRLITRWTFWCYVLRCSPQMLLLLLNYLWSIVVNSGLTLVIMVWTYIFFFPRKSFLPCWHGPWRLRAANCWQPRGALKGLTFHVTRILPINHHYIIIISHH